MSEIRSSRDRPPLIGSQHIYSDGYGYGMRYPTERNQMTLPANVAKYRHPPDSARFVEGMRSTQVIRRDDQSLRRNAEQIVYQTSGEIGFHTIGFDPEPVRLNKKATQRPHAQLYHPPIPSSFTVASLSPAKAQTQTQTQIHTQTQTQSNNGNKETSSGKRERETHSAQSSARIGSARSAWTSASHSRNNDEFRPYRDERPPPRTASGISSRNTENNNRYLETLHSLDSTFARQSRRDLFTASLPPKPQHELVWLATANNRAALQSKPWENKLRREPNS